MTTVLELRRLGLLRTCLKLPSTLARVAEEAIITDPDRQNTKKSDRQIEVYVPSPRVIVNIIPMIMNLRSR